MLLARMAGRGTPIQVELYMEASYDDPLQVITVPMENPYCSCKLRRAGGRSAS